jgi:hypothetical protein
MRFLVMLLLSLATVGFAGCRERSVPPPVEVPPIPSSDISPITSVSLNPHTILDQMVAAYQTAASYSDHGSVQIIGKMSQSDSKSIPWNCIVAFQKPNKLRLEVAEGIFVSDGEYCYAQIQPLPQQVLHFPSLDQWTLETLFQDVHLDRAMELGLPFSVLRFPPQLVLLFANNPLHTFCPKGAKIEWMAQRTLGRIQCDVIQISHSDGNRILWISRENQALLRFDYQPVGLPVPEGFDSVEAIRIEMTDARFGWNFLPDTFQMLQPQDAVLVAEFQSDIPGLPSPAEHQRRLMLMTESDCYRHIDHHAESAASTEQSPLSKVEPRTFALSPLWTVPLTGVDTMESLSGATPILLIPYEGNLVAELDLQGNIIQRISPVGLEDAIITNIKGNTLSDERKIGIITLDSKFYLYDMAFRPLDAYKAESAENTKGKIKDFQFVQHQGDELLLLGIQQDSVQEGVPADRVLLAVDVQGTKHWKHHYEGVLNQISSAVMENQNCILVSCTDSKDSIFIFSHEGQSLDTVEMPSGRHVIWFHVLDSTIYTLLETMDTGDVRFVGFDKRGKSLWSRLLPAGEYEVDPIYVPSEKKWLVPSPSSEIFVFDLIGNMIDTFSLNVIPTGLLCVEVGGETLLVVADGETVSAWKIGKNI